MPTPSKKLTLLIMTIAAIIAGLFAFTQPAHGAAFKTDSVTLEVNSPAIDLTNVDLNKLTLSHVSWSCGDNATFTYDGEEVTYGTVAYDGECWLDRNLGATSTASALDDSSSYGDYYQWGRCQEGHEWRYSTTIDQLATTSACDAGHVWDGKYILSSLGDDYDWLKDPNNFLWASTTKKNDPCPNGWRVPTKAEWNSASSTGGWTTSEDVISSPLKLPAGGERQPNGDGFAEEGTRGLYWSSTHYGDSASNDFEFDSSSVLMEQNSRAYGFPVRCIEEAYYPPGPQPYCADSSRQGTSTTLNGDTIYCDNDGRMWSPTADVDGTSTTYAWATSTATSTLLNGSCIRRGEDYPACSYCDNLSYAGYEDWTLPSCVSGYEDENCVLWTLYDESGDCTGWDDNAQSNTYWSSTEYDSSYAYSVDFGYDIVATTTKAHSTYVRCVR